jgi:site-specific DNA-methyltransferase (cytosine-N4-specific)
MVQLLRSQKYNSGRRPSEHKIGKATFLAKHKGAIPSNVLAIANTGSRDPYMEFCRQRKLPIHPARMPSRLAEFFVSFLTMPGDLVLDPFAGSNVTGAAAERLDRRWVSIEPSKEYALGSYGRFVKS